MKILWVLLLGAVAMTASAQTASKCEESFAAFEARYRAGEYNEALKLMPDLKKKCPKHSDKLYVFGENILKYQIEASRTPEDKKKYTDELVVLYDEMDMNFPALGGSVKKILLQRQHKQISDDDAYKALDNAFNKNRKSFIDYNALETYFMLFQERYKAGKGVTDEEFIQKYGDITSQATYAKSQITTLHDELLKKKETQALTDEETQYMIDVQPTLDALDAVSDNISKMASGQFNCEKMEAYYTRDYDKQKNNNAWLSGMVSVLYSNKCFGSSLLFEGAKTIHTAKPTTESAYRLAFISLKKGDKKQALTYFEKAAELEQNPVRKAELFYEMASVFRNTDKAEAKKYALKSAELNSKSGKPYIFLAGLYTAAGKECELTDFERKALYWLATETARKAEAAEARYKPTVAKLIEGYAKKQPTKDQLKASGKKKGDTMTVGCWINETIIIPN